MLCPDCKKVVWAHGEDNINIDLDTGLVKSERYYKCYDCDKVFVWDNGILRQKTGTVIDCKA